MLHKFQNLISASTNILDDVNEQKKTKLQIYMYLYFSSLLK